MKRGNSRCSVAVESQRWIAYRPAWLVQNCILSNWSLRSSKSINPKFSRIIKSYLSYSLLLNHIYLTAPWKSGLFIAIFPDSNALHRETPDFVHQLQRMCISGQSLILSREANWNGLPLQLLSIGRSQGYNNDESLILAHCQVSMLWCSESYSAANPLRR